MFNDDKSKSEYFNFEELAERVSIRSFAETFNLHDYSLALNTHHEKIQMEAQTSAEQVT